jgi:hypothetical protein
MKQLAIFAALAALVTATSISPALAQPGADPPPDYPGAEPPPSPPPNAPQPPVTQPRQVQPRTIQMTPEERELILRGEIDPGLYVAGAVLGTFVTPFGIGQAVQGRWMDKGWIFTLGEGVSIALIIAGAARFDQSDGGEGLLVAGVLGVVGFRIWEMIDLWVGPPLHNQRVRRVHMKYGIAPGSVFYGAAPYVAPTGDGGIAGFTFRL